jgi:cell division protein FtsL
MSILSRLFEQRIRGFRLIEVVGVVLAVSVFMWVTVSKALVRDDISRLNAVNEQIEAELKTVSALRVHVAALEAPKRLEALAKQQLGMGPADPMQEASLDSLAQLSRTSQRPSTVQGPVVSAETLEQCTFKCTRLSVKTLRKNKGLDRYDDSEISHNDLVAQQGPQVISAQSPPNAPDSVARKPQQSSSKP